MSARGVTLTRAAHAELQIVNQRVRGYAAKALHDLVVPWASSSFTMKGFSDLCGSATSISFLQGCTVVTMGLQQLVVFGFEAEEALNS